MAKIEYAEIYGKNDLKLIGIVDVFKSIIWRTCYYDTGDFEIYCPDTKANVSLLQRGRWVRIPSDENVAVIEKIQTTCSAQDGRMLVVTGRMATGILDRRIVYKRSGNLCYPINISGNVQKAIVTLLNSCFISPEDSQRKYDLLTTEIATASPAVLVGDDGSPAQRQVIYENLFEYVRNLLEEYSLGARMVFKGDALCHQQYAGKELSAVFSTEFDNLNSSEYTEDETEYKNVALVAGESQDDKRQTTLIYGTQFKGIDRREIYIDGSSLQKTYEDSSGEEKRYTEAEYQAIMRSFGKNELAGLGRKKTLAGTMNVTTTGLQIREDFDLGDVVIIEDKKLGVYAPSRILEATEVQDEGGYTLDLVYGE